MCVFLVFPASAGVFLPPDPADQEAARRPRLGGGVSRGAPEGPACVWSSPPRLGCFCCCVMDGSVKQVFPASAGVFLTVSLSASDTYGLPRLGGGVSRVIKTVFRGEESSPPRRGCFRRFPVGSVKKSVFPASAGVFLRRLAQRGEAPCLPRLGGGVSLR